MRVLNRSVTVTAPIQNQELALHTADGDDINRLDAPDHGVAAGIIDMDV